jgi:hypothetical protein
MELDKKFNSLIKKLSFLTEKEKEALISKLSHLDEGTKKRLFDFLISQELKITAIKIKHFLNFQRVYKKWKEIFEKISQMI